MINSIPEDISEASNMAAANPEKKKEMATELGKYLREVKAVRPSFKETGKPCLWPDQSPQSINKL